jgi:ATPase subunit of ABC transporter with duplicated ATPase domains
MSKTWGKGDGSRPVFKDVSLSFFPGAKIGVLGANGAGKSTLMKIMAGVEENFEGEARLARWAKVSTCDPCEWLLLPHPMISMPSFWYSYG